MEGREGKRNYSLILFCISLVILHFGGKPYGEAGKKREPFSALSRAHKRKGRYLHFRPFCPDRHARSPSNTHCTASSSIGERRGEELRFYSPGDRPTDLYCPSCFRPPFPVYHARKGNEPVFPRQCLRSMNFSFFIPILASFCFLRSIKKRESFFCVGKFFFSSVPRILRDVQLSLACYYSSKPLNKNQSLRGRKRALFKKIRRLLRAPCHHFR